MDTRNASVLVFSVVMLVGAGCSKQPQANSNADQPVTPAEPARAEKIGNVLPLKGGMGIRAMFAPDGKTAVVESADLHPGQTHYVQIFSTETGELIAEAGKGFHRVYFSPDGETFATRNPLQLWDARTGKPIGGPIQEEGDAGTFPFSRDGKVLLSTGAKFVRLWNARTGEAIGAPLEHEAPFFDAIFSRDCKLLLTTCANHKKAYLWDVRTGSAVGRPLEHATHVRKCIFSPDNRLALTISGTSQVSDVGEVHLWDVAKSQPIGNPVYKGDLDYFNPFGFGSDSRSFYVRSRASLRFYDASTCKPLDLSSNPEGGVGYSPDGKYIVNFGTNTAAVWEIATGRTVQQPLNRVFLLKFPDYRSILTAEQWAIATSKEFPLADNGILVLKFSSDGALAIGDPRGSGKALVADWRVWDTATWTEICEPLQLVGKAYSSVEGVFASPDKRTLIVVGHAGPVGGYQGIKDQAQMWRLPAFRP